MFVKCLSTRHTAIGTLRFGVVYEPDMKNGRIAKVINALLDVKPSPLEKLTKKQAEAEKAGVLSLMPAEGEQDQIGEMVPAKAASDALDAKQAELDAALVEIEGLQTAKAEGDEIAAKALDAKQAELDAAQDEIKELKAAPTDAGSAK
jgi:hypothetical protein